MVHVHRGAAPPLCAMEPVSLAARLHAALQSAFFFFSRNEPRLQLRRLIPLIGFWPPESPATARLGLSHSLTFWSPPAPLTSL